MLGGAAVAKRMKAHYDEDKHYELKDPACNQGIYSPVTDQSLAWSYRELPSLIVLLFRPVAAGKSMPRLS